MIPTAGYFHNRWERKKRVNAPRINPTQPALPPPTITTLKKRKRKKKGGEERFVPFLIVVKVWEGGKARAVHVVDAAWRSRFFSHRRGRGEKKKDACSSSTAVIEEEEVEKMEASSLTCGRPSLRENPPLSRGAFVTTSPTGSTSPIFNANKRKKRLSLPPLPEERKKDGHGYHLRLFDGHFRPQ